MKKKSKGKLLIFSGPSCVGKSPLVRSLERLYPELYQSFQPLILYNSRSARPGEKDAVDYYFRPREEIDNLREQDRYIVMDVRGDLQALDLQELHDNLAKGDVMFEGNPFVGGILHTHHSLKEVKRLSIFMSPLSRDEIMYFQSPESSVYLPDLLTDIMRRKLLRRTRKQKGELSLMDLENIERRASSAYTELKGAYKFQYIIPNHDGEDSENWDAFYYPLGDARRALNDFVSILANDIPQSVEQWKEGLFG